MAYDFPKAHDVHIQLLYDRSSYRHNPGDLLIKQITGNTEENTESILDAVVNSRPTSNSTPFELLKHNYNRMRLQTLLGLADPNGIFKTTVPYDAELQKELVDKGDWCIHVVEDKKTMEVSTVPF